jgi:hypothetical protein
MKTNIAFTASVALTMLSSIIYLPILEMPVKNELQGMLAVFLTIR